MTRTWINDQLKRRKVLLKEKSEIKKSFSRVLGEKREEIYEIFSQVKRAANALSKKRGSWAKYSVCYHCLSVARVREPTDEHPHYFEDSSGEDDYKCKYKDYEYGDSTLESSEDEDID